jgi:hypothetical protein
LFGSATVSEFPEVFGEFGGKNFALLWQGSRDGFAAQAFHSRCDGHANSLTVILDTDGNVFVGVEWNFSGTAVCHKTDPTLKTFVFTLKNPQGFPARRFMLRPEKKHVAIDCNSERGPHFWAIGVLIVRTKISRVPFITLGRLL